jgi:LacI family transcriptional regulator
VPASPAPHPTQADVARAAGVSQPTVSRHLRDAHAVPAATRARIEHAIRQLGYTPDPLLSALTSRRHETGTRRAFQPLAYVFNGPDASGWKAIPEHRRVFEAARRHAEELGWKLEPFWATAPRLDPAKASRRLADRGIKGLVIAPLHSAHDHLELEWNRFCSVAIGRSLAAPDLHRVTANLYASGTRICTELARRRYRRAGVVLCRHSAERTDYVLPAAFSAFSTRDLGLASTLLVVDEWDEAGRRAFAAWLRREKPDVICSDEPTPLTWLRESGHRVPIQIGFAMHSSPRPEIAGIAGNATAFGRLVTDWLGVILRRNETGVPAIMVEDLWREGETLRPPLSS